MSDFSDGDLDHLERVAPEYVERRADGTRAATVTRRELHTLAIRFPSMHRGVFATRAPEPLRTVRARYPTMK